MCLRASGLPVSRPSCSRPRPSAVWGLWPASVSLSPLSLPASAGKEGNGATKTAAAAHNASLGRVACEVHECSALGCCSGLTQGPICARTTVVAPGRQARPRLPNPTFANVAE